MVVVRLAHQVHLTRVCSICWRAVDRDGQPGEKVSPADNSHRMHVVCVPCKADWYKGFVPT